LVFQTTLTLPFNTRTRIYHKHTQNGGFLAAGDEVRYVPITTLTDASGDCPQWDSFSASSPDTAGQSFGGILQGTGDNIYVDVNLPDIDASNTEQEREFCFFKDSRRRKLQVIGDPQVGIVARGGGRLVVTAFSPPVRSLAYIHNHSNPHLHTLSQLTLVSIRSLADSSAVSAVRSLRFEPACAHTQHTNTLFTRSLALQWGQSRCGLTAFRFVCLLCSQASADSRHLHDRIRSHQAGRHDSDGFLRHLPKLGKFKPRPASGNMVDVLRPADRRLWKCCRHGLPSLPPRVHRRRKRARLLVRKHVSYKLGLLLISRRHVHCIR
jgi:hypothetical protein